MHRLTDGAWLCSYVRLKGSAPAAANCRRPLNTCMNRCNLKAGVGMTALAVLPKPLRKRQVTCRPSYSLCGNTAAERSETVSGLSYSCRASIFCPTQICWQRKASQQLFDSQTTTYKAVRSSRTLPDTPPRPQRSSIDQLPPRCESCHSVLCSPHRLSRVDSAFEVGS